MPPPPCVFCKKIKFVRTYREVPSRVPKVRVSTLRKIGRGTEIATAGRYLFANASSFTRRFAIAGNTPYFFRLMVIPPLWGELGLGKRLARMHDLVSCTSFVDQVISWRDVAMVGDGWHSMFLYEQRRRKGFERGNPLGFPSEEPKAEKTQPHPIIPLLPSEP